MIIVDDKLSLDVLSGRPPAAGPAATTWGFHYRLLRALGDESRWGTLSKSASPSVRTAVAEPPPTRLTVLDPRTVTAEAAALAIRYGLNVLAAELIASAVHYSAEVYLSSPNVGRQWPDVMAAEGVRFTAV